ncbi:MAG: DNA polymerase IV [Ruminococcus sp.]|uniref:DNA polymerase IV n=1 Tax=Ruminococcus sp. TaxID=41978 RepID=UPI002872EA02|nr:DNA polymerase IV [Ruminococcus sp.]MBQ3284102.1 DNA polymerase IV [Ruminococcus sp.]
MRTILHSDCNGFYASVECLYNPDVRDKPVAVGGDADKRHGIILAKNEIAKKYKIKTGEAIWQAREKCPDLIVIKPHFERYMRFSRLCRRIYADYTDRIEPFGLDEAWLDVSSNAMDGKDIAQEIRKRIKNELGITVSIGVSFNKIFAKLGSDYKKPDAVTVIPYNRFKEIVWPLDAGDLLYVGHSTKRRLNVLGVHTIGELANFPLPLLRSNFGKWGDVLYTFSNGLDNSPVMHMDESTAIQSIGNSTTTPRDLVCDRDVEIIFTVLCDSVCRRLREHGAKAREVSISVRNSTLESFTRQMKLLTETDITSEVIRAAMTLFSANYHWDKPIRSLGVKVAELSPASAPSQLTIMCDEAQRERLGALDRSLDVLKRRFGSFCVRPASLLYDKGLSSFSPKEEHIIHPVGYF